MGSLKSFEEQGLEVLNYAERLMQSLLDNKGFEAENFNLGKGSCFLTLLVNNVEIASLGSIFPQDLNVLVKNIVEKLFEKARQMHEDLHGKDLVLKLVLLKDFKKVDKSRVESFNAKKHCFIVTLNSKLGFVLPTTSIEFGLSSVEALEVACQKAGLWFNAWKHESATVFACEAVIKHRKI